jgi:hypothetical protein
MIKFSMTTTRVVTTGGIIALGIYDLIVVGINPNTELSVSRFLADMGFKAPAVVFAIGFVCGHLFGYMKPVSCEDLNRQS